MSPPPPEKGKKPVTGDAGSSNQDNRRRDGSPRPSELETADDRASTDEAQEEEDSHETTLAQLDPSRSRTQGRLSRFLTSSFSGRQDGNSGEMLPKKVPGSAVPSQSNSHHRAQLPLTDHNPGAHETPSSAQLPDSRKKAKRSVFNRASRDDDIANAATTDPAGFLSKAEAGKQYLRAKPPVSKDLDFRIFEPQLSSEASAGLKTESLGEPVDTTRKPSPSLMEASRPTIPEPRSGGDVDGSSSGAEDEILQEAEGPSKRVQRVMVDRVMSSFMSWLDMKLKIKTEDESSEPEQSLLGITHWGSVNQNESDFSPPSTPVPFIAPQSTKSAIESIFDTPVPSRRSDPASRSALPSPPPPPLQLAPVAPSYIPDKGRKVGVAPRLAVSQSCAPNALMAAPPPPSPPTHLARPPLRPASSAYRGVTVAAAPAPASQKRTLSARPSAKSSSKHDRSTDERKGEEQRNSDGDENRPPRAKLSKVHEDGGNGAKFACPFFKHNPRKYKNQRPCCGPGWDHVHRIKEHIYRKHSLPRFSCPRCSQPFETQADLQAHARSADACEVREPEVLDGITQDQEKRLRSRKKTSAKELTEAQKWMQVYSILFPDVREREIPSPYYSTEDADTSLGGYEDYLRRELPPLVRRQLEIEIERELSFVEEGMKHKVIEIARNLQLTLFKGYQQLENQEQGVQDPPSADASASQTDGSTSSATDTSPSTVTTSGTTPDVPDPLDLFSDYTHPDFDFTFLSEVPFPEEQQQLKDQTFDFGPAPSFEPQLPATIQPGMKKPPGQQLDLPYYEVEGYHDSRDRTREAEYLGYAP
ncbi:hypothetical protein LZ30DRAFT_597759 [Colletotrichum cereale]|nr:hypothetical protein LZ30DRAFT_597759 [Colletotrichum cereale]